MAPLLAAIHLAAADRSATFVVELGGEAQGDAYPELILPACLSRAAQTLIEPFIVREWPGCIFKGSDSVTVPLSAALLDPTQIALEIDGLGSRIVIRRAEGLSEIRPGPGAHGLDLRVWSPPLRRHRIIGAEALRALALPVIADFTAVSPPVDYLQYIPIGGERILIGTVLRHEGQAAPRAANDPFALNPLHAALNAICS